LSSAKAVNDDSQEETDATLPTATVLDLETKIATLHWTDEKSNSPTLSNRVLPVDGLESAVPSFPWAVYLGAAGPTNHRLEHIVLGQDTAVLEIARLVMETPLSSWQHYLRFHYLDSNRLTASHRPNAAHRLTANIEAADRSTLDALSALLSDRAKTDIGASIASPELRQVAEVIANDLKTAFREVVSESALLTPEQKSAALKRLGSLSVRIGSKPNDMLQSRIGVIGVDDLAMTSVDALHQSARYIPVDSSGRREAGTPPWDPDASYDPDDNTVYVSEALLTPMFLDPRIILAANYGRFGTIIGHEMVHAVDEFSAGVAPYASLSSTLFAEPYARIKALLEASDLGTNKIDTDGLSKMLLADAIGLNIAQRAWQKRTASSEDGIRSQSQQTDAWANPFDEQQRFFISWAQLWATPAQHSNTQQPMFRAEALRATIPLRLMDSWYRAFDISQGETIVLE
ncbi:MAG: M13-type metalloendopeptidase, partial [Pseudomonadota bacterium]